MTGGALRMAEGALRMTGGLCFFLFLLIFPFPLTPALSR